MMRKKPMSTTDTLSQQEQEEAIVQLAYETDEDLKLLLARADQYMADEDERIAKVTAALPAQWKLWDKIREERDAVQKQLSLQKKLIRRMELSRAKKKTEAYRITMRHVSSRKAQIRAREEKKILKAEFEKRISQTI